MRAREFVREAEETSLADNVKGYSDVIMVLGTIFAEVKANKIKPDIPFDALISRIRNEIPTFDIDDLIDAREKIPAIQRMVKNIDTSRKMVEINTGKPDSTEIQQQQDATTAPEQTVSAMAQSALKRRQDQ